MRRPGKALAVLAAALFALCASAAGAEEGERPAEEPDPRRVAVGERLIYNVKAKGISAGQAILAVDGEDDCHGRDSWKVSLSVSSNKFASIFCKIRDRAESTIERSTLRSLGFIANKRENDRRRYESIIPDYDAMICSTSRRKNDREPDEREFDIAGGVQDSVSWFFALRGMTLEPGGEAELRVVSTSRVFDLTLKAVGTEKVRVKRHGALDAVKVVVAEGGEALMGSDGEVTLWLERRTMIPLRIVVIAKGHACGMYLSVTENSALD